MEMCFSRLQVDSTLFVAGARTRQEQNKIVINGMSAARSIQSVGIDVYRVFIGRSRAMNLAAECAFIRRVGKNKFDRVFGCNMTGTMSLLIDSF